MGYSLKEALTLFELHSAKDEALHKMLKFSPSAKILYTRILARSIDTKSKQRWILKPKNGVSRAESIEKWLSDDEPSAMCSKDLLSFYRPSTYRDALAILISSKLIFIDEFNKMFLSYPVDGKLLSLEYAVKSIKASYRKYSEEENEEERKEESNEVSDEATGTKEVFW